MRQIQTRDVASRRGRGRQSADRVARGQRNNLSKSAERASGPSTPALSRVAALRRRPAGRRGAAEPSRRARVLGFVPAVGRSRSGRPSGRRPFAPGGVSSRSPRWRRRRQGRASGMLDVAGAVLKRRPRPQSKKGPTALALAAAGAAGAALAKRRRSAAANEPPQEPFVGGEQTTEPQDAMAERPADEAAIVSAPEAERRSAG